MSRHHADRRELRADHRRERRSSWSTSGRPGAARAASSRPSTRRPRQTHPDIVFGTVDTEAEQALAAAAQITSIPTLMAFKEGTLVFSQPGALPAAALEQVITAVRDLDMDAGPRPLDRHEEQDS